MIHAARRSRVLAVVFVLVAAAASPQDGRDLAQELMIVDANILTSYRLTLDEADITIASDIGEFDAPRAAEGGLDLAVMGMLIPSSLRDAAEARDVADTRIDEWLELFERSDQLALVTTATQARAAAADGTVGILLAIENGAPFGADVESVRHFYDRGVRLVTLVHSRPNQIGDSSYAQHRPWNGLSPVGRDMVKEMNRVGMILDVSHIADATFDAVLELSAAPVIASHSSCRSFTPGWERNLDDARIRRLAERGGVIHITFGGSFLSTELMNREQPVWDHVEGQGLSINSVKGRSEAREFRTAGDIEYAVIDDVIDHIDHVVELVGVDHVGIGSGFDGSGDSMPTGLKDASDYPALIDGLLARGYGAADIEKILSGNFFRVWHEVERLAQAKR